jgi:hypothetical protein
MTTISDSEDDLNYNNISNSSCITIENEMCFFYILIIDLLKQMPQIDEIKNIWPDKCREYYRGDETILQQIADFSKEYKANDAIKWYTEDSFVYHLLNRALRTAESLYGIYLGII